MEHMDQIAQGLAVRLRSIVAVIDRLDQLESGSGDWVNHFHRTELAEAATDLTLRAFRFAADPQNYRLLAILRANQTMPLSELMASTSQGRLALSERINDLVQVGLAARLIDTDHVQLTAAGAGVVHLIESISRRVSEGYLSKPLKEF